ncbi:MAG: DUF4113 domain-containing protein [Deltaproteobacteria bacterium]|nr:DUF4113 domain-containing protein [Deltaproteobacteria bacterium]
MIKIKRLDTVIDNINQHYGRQTIHLATSLCANKNKKATQDPSVIKPTNTFEGTHKKRLGIPVLQLKMV